MLTTKQWVLIVNCWKHIDEKLITYIRETQVNITKKPQAGSVNSRNDIEYYMTLLNSWPYCNVMEGVRYYLSYSPSFEHMFIKGSGISFRYDEWVHFLALIPAINHERRSVK